MGIEKTFGDKMKRFDVTVVIDLDAGDAAEARAIAQALVTEGAAACESHVEDFYVVEVEAQ